MTASFPAYTVLDALTNLRRVAADIPEANLDMDSWGNIARSNLRVTDGEAFVDLSNGPSCDTAMCLAGWATQDPWFQARGLTSTVTAPDLDGQAFLVLRFTGQGPTDASGLSTRALSAYRMSGLPDAVHDALYCTDLSSIELMPTTIRQLLAVIDFITDHARAGTLDDLGGEHPDDILMAAYDAAGIEYDADA